MVKLLMPNDSKFISLIYSPVDKYLSAFSIYQDWMMFAPNPNRQNLFISARVDFLDGSHEMYTFPGYKNQSQKDRYIFGERYRKFLVEGLNDSRNSFLYRDASRFVLRKLRDQNFSKIPSRIQLFRNWEVIPDMDKEFRLHGHQVKNYQVESLYTYEVI
jgi:hypothetical protein